MYTVHDGYLLTEDAVIYQEVEEKFKGSRFFITSLSLTNQYSTDHMITNDVIVFMDMQMPEMDGLEATRQICKQWTACERPVVIAMTASEEEKDKESCLQAGMNDFLTKPIRLEQLREMLEKYL